jgi:CHASE3 domain sensor protein
METGVRGYLLSKKTHFLEPYELSREDLNIQIKIMMEYTKKDSSAHKKVEDWIGKIQIFSRLLATQIEKVDSGSIIEQDLILEAQKQKMDELRAFLEDYIEERINILNHQLKQFQSNQQNFTYILIIGTISSIAVMLMVTLVILSLLKRNEKAQTEAENLQELYTTVINGINDGIHKGSRLI